MTYQWTQSQLDELYAAKKFDEIDKAREEGRWDALLGVPADDLKVLDFARAGGLLGDHEVHELTRLRRHDLITQAADEHRIVGMNTGATDV